MPLWPLFIGLVLLAHSAAATEYALGNATATFVGLGTDIPRDLALTGPFVAVLTHRVAGPTTRIHILARNGSGLVHAPWDGVGDISWRMVSVRNGAFICVAYSSPALRCYSVNPVTGEVTQTSTAAISGASGTQRVLAVAGGDSGHFVYVTTSVFSVINIFPVSETGELGARTVFDIATECAPVLAPFAAPPLVTSAIAATPDLSRVVVAWRTTVLDPLTTALAVIEVDMDTGLSTSCIHLTETAVRPHIPLGDPFLAVTDTDIIVSAISSTQGYTAFAARFNIATLALENVTTLSHARIFAPVVMNYLYAVDSVSLGSVGDVLQSEYPSFTDESVATTLGSVTSPIVQFIASPERDFLYFFSTSTLGPVPATVYTIPRVCAEATYVCDPCPEGAIFVDGETCTPCEQGTFAPFLNATECTPCPPGEVSEEGASECAPCEAGTVASDGVCVACAEGKYSAGGATVCTDCDAGTFSAAMGASSAATCTACDAGTYSETTGATNGATCILCAEGRYSAASGASSIATCTACDAGTYSAAMGASSIATCTACDAGTYSEATGATNGATCIVCEAGTFAETTGLNACLPCEDETVSEAGASACVPCDPSTIWVNATFCAEPEPEPEPGPEPDVNAAAVHGPVIWIIASFGVASVAAVGVVVGAVWGGARSA
jgi:hypothetical protein